jgi:cell division protein FtsZ
MRDRLLPPDVWGPLSGPPSIAVVGLGGAGCEAVQDLAGLGIPGARSFAVNTDAAHLSRVRAEERILLGDRELKGRGSGGDRAAVLRAAEESREEVLRRLAPFEIVFLLAGLGGGTGSALLPFFSRHLRRTTALPVPVVFLPFLVELEANPTRRDNVEETVVELERMGGLLLALANEKLRRFDNLPIHRVFQVRNAYLHSLVASLVDMVENPSQLNVDLASLKSHLRESGLSTLTVGEQHFSEPERLVHEALSGTMLDFRLSERTSVLVHLDGGANLTLGTLDRVLDAVRTELHGPERLVFGTRLSSEPRDAVRLTAIVGGLRPRTVREAIGARGSAPPVGIPFIR